MSGSRFDGRVAIITGGASGIGEATARLFHREGARLVIADRDAARGEALIAELGGERAIFVQCDVGVRAEVEGVVARAIAQFGRDKGFGLARLLGFRRGKTPTKATYSVLFRRLDVVAFEAAVARWIASRLSDEEMAVLALDGIGAQADPP